MKRRSFLKGSAAMTATLFLVPVSIKAGEDIRYFHDVSVSDRDLERLSATDADWREKLSREAWDVLFRERTEQAYSSPLDEETRDGTYVCAACYLPLFSSETKYDSGTGWPSFWQPIEGHYDTKRDYKLIWPRTEYHCVRCGGHQGHVFDDGPEPTGQRWCNNGLALKFVPADESLPDLRG